MNFLRRLLGLPPTPVSAVPARTSTSPATTVGVGAVAPTPAPERTPEAAVPATGVVVGSRSDLTPTPAKESEPVIVEIKPTVNDTIAGSSTPETSPSITEPALDGSDTLPVQSVALPVAPSANGTPPATNPLTDAPPATQEGRDPVGVKTAPLNMPLVMSLAELDGDAATPGATRQLPPMEPFLSRPGKHLTFGVQTDVGSVRTTNQDALYAMYGTHMSVDELPGFGIFVVADGMGGHHDGEKASALASRVIARHVAEQFYMKLLVMRDGDDRPIVSEVLNDAVLKANQVVGEQIPEGGTTCTATIILGDLAYVAHVGDSRAYLLSEDGIEQITRDHSLVQRLIELDQLTPDEAANHPQRNVLYRALGQNDSIDVDTITRRLPPGARLLLCSDGLWNHVPEALIVQIVRNAKTPQDACDALIAKANERGGLDNITAILVQIPG